MTTEAILQRVAELTRPAPAPEKWSFLSSVSGVRQLPFVDSEIMDVLREEFTSEQLEAARVLVRTPDGELELNAVLVGDSNQGLFLRQAKDSAPHDIVNAKGSLTRNFPPMFGCCHDYFTKGNSRHLKQNIFVTITDSDLSVLRMLGLPCTPAAGLAAMNGEQLRLLFENLPGFPMRESNQGNAIAIASGGYRLVLVGWGVAEIRNELPEGVGSIVTCVLNAEDAYGVDTSRRVAAWQPTDRDFGRIQSAAEVQDRGLARKLIWKSSLGSTLPVRNFQNEITSRNPPTYTTVRRWTGAALRGLARLTVAALLSCLFRFHSKLSRSGGQLVQSRPFAVDRCKTCRSLSRNAATPAVDFPLPRTGPVIDGMQSFALAPQTVATTTRNPKTYLPVLAGTPSKPPLERPRDPDYTPPVVPRGPITHQEKPWSAAPVAGGRIRQGEATMKLHELSDNPGATKPRKRIGRGPGSGTGKTGGRGIKGQKSRSGVAIKGYEGGQMPLYQRLPKRGFNKPNRKKFAVINLGIIQKFIDAGKLGAEITETELVDSGVVRRKLDGIRVLAKGELTSKVTLTVTGASKSAIDAVAKAGGSLTVTKQPAAE